MIKDFALGFSVSNLGPKRFLKILNTFDSLEKGWYGTEKKFESLGIGKLTYKKFDEFRKRFDYVWYAGQMKKANVEFVSYIDKRYPASLKKLENPPIGLFVKGNKELLKEPFVIAVVGTRKATSYGREVTEFLVSKLVQSDVCIISGLALGIDGVAHRTTVENHGKTIAVLGCGVDCCLPSENYNLYSQILANDGIIISEYPLGSPPNKGTFLARNRIIAALSDGVLVPEAAEGSGSLVTAEWGLKLSKKVFAVPGQINAHMSKGSLSLLKKGAVIVQDVADILREFRIQNSKLRTTAEKFKTLKLSKDERKIVLLLQKEGMTIDEISKKSKITIGVLFGIISSLEIQGIVKNSGGIISLVSLQNRL